MANENDNLEIGSFSIQDTMELGSGNKELLEGLYSTEDTKPEDISPIVKEVEAPKAEEKIEKTDKETVDPPITNEKSSLSNFLEDFKEEEKEEVKEKSEEVKTPKTEADDSVEVPVGQFSALANDLFNLGVFNKEEGEEDVNISTPEEFLERFHSEKKKGAIEMVDNFIGQFGEDYKNAFDAIFVKGVNPKDYFGVYNTLVNFAELDVSSEDNQVRVMRQALADQGFEAEDIDTEIERLKNYGDLEAVAQRNHKVLVKRDAKKLEEMEATAERELQIKAQTKTQYINTVQSLISEKLKTKEFDGLPVNPKIAAELQDFLLVDKWKTVSGETLTDFDRTILDLKKPENYATKVKLGLLIKILEKDPTLSTVQKTGVTKKSDQLFGEVARQTVKHGNQASTAKEAPGSSWWK